jgi:hypothetical protein
MRVKTSPLFELACVLVCFDHVGSRIVKPNRSVMWPNVKLRVTDSVANRIRLAGPQPTERQHIRNQIDATIILRGRTS